MFTKRLRGSEEQRLEQLATMHRAFPLGHRRVEASGEGWRCPVAWVDERESTDKFLMLRWVGRDAEGRLQVCEERYLRGAIQVRELH